MHWTFATEGDLLEVRIYDESNVRRLAMFGVPPEARDDLTAFLAGDVDLFTLEAAYNAPLEFRWGVADSVDIVFYTVDDSGTGGEITLGVPEGRSMLMAALAQLG